MRPTLFFVALAIAMPSSAQAQQPMAKPQVDKSDPDYVRCRRLDVTGSLVKKVRVCKTNAEWGRLADHGSAEAQRIFQNNLEGSSSNGN